MARFNSMGWQATIPIGSLSESGSVFSHIGFDSDTDSDAECYPDLNHAKLDMVQIERLPGNRKTNRWRRSANIKEA